jgi:hypothetical protein
MSAALCRASRPQFIRRSALRRSLSYLKQEIRSLAGLHPLVFHLYLAIIERHAIHALTRRDTELVIEGFGGSANSFATAAFRYVQPRRYRMAHHLHTPAQVLRGLKWKIPTLVVIRDPIEVCISLLSRDYCVTPSQALRHYIRFYEPIMSYRGDVVIADFREITQAYGDVIRRVNERFETDFVPFEHTPENVKWIFGKQSKAPDIKPVPTEQRAVLKEAARAYVEREAPEQLRKRAEDVYHRFLRGTEAGKTL